MGHISTSKKIILSVLGILLILSLLVGVSYAYYMVSVSQTNKNVVKSSCLNLSISNEENVIKLEKQIPIMNEEGKKLTPYTFTINNTCNSMMAYSLNLEELEGSTLSSKYIMTMINSKAYINMASLGSTDNYYANSVESRVLATGSLGPNASINYSLRLWMDEATPMTTDAMNKSFRSKVVVVATPTKTVDFDYTGTEQVFTAPVSGTYKLETWGAQGGVFDNQIASLGGYSIGTIYLNNNDVVYINVGGKGKNDRIISKDETCIELNLGGYNGGGNGTKGCNFSNTVGGGGGGGATHIATRSGLLSSLGNYRDSILIVSGGGGGSAYNNYSEGGKTQLLGGSGGGYSGNLQESYSGSDYNNKGKKATQTDGFAFGKGANAVMDQTDAGGGGGYFGGYADDTLDGSGWISGTGGSGYIGNPLLGNKVMYCYNCEESSEESTKTISTTCAEETPTSNCAKKGNGYARITYIG